MRKRPPRKHSRRQCFRHRAFLLPERNAGVRPGARAGKPRQDGGRDVEPYQAVRDACLPAAKAGQRNPSTRETSPNITRRHSLAAGSPCRNRRGLPADTAAGSYQSSQGQASPPGLRPSPGAYSRRTGFRSSAVSQGHHVEAQAELSAAPCRAQGAGPPDRRGCFFSPEAAARWTGRFLSAPSQPGRAPSNKLPRSSALRLRKAAGADVKRSGMQALRQGDVEPSRQPPVDSSTWLRCPG